MSMFFYVEKLGTGTQYSKSGHEELGGQAEEPRVSTISRSSVTPRAAKTPQAGLHPSALYATSSISKGSVTPIEKKIWTPCHTCSIL
jgi:hypothetical protein